MLLFNPYWEELRLSALDLNTSHVIVQHILGFFKLILLVFKYISCYCSTADYHPFDNSIFQFKYISCYCSTQSNLKSYGGDNNLNTSHVIVQLDPLNEEIKINLNLNTSHVIVQHARGCRRFQTTIHLNTSHVIVQQGVAYIKGVAVKFKYISCYCSTNTCLHNRLNLSEFKYISCYCSTVSEDCRR